MGGYFLFLCISQTRATNPIRTLNNVRISSVLMNAHPRFRGKNRTAYRYAASGAALCIMRMAALFLLYHRCLNLSNFKIRSNTNVLLHCISFRLLFRRILRNFFPREAEENYCTSGALQISCCHCPCNKRPENRSRLLFPLN